MKSKKPKISGENYCGLTDFEVRDILSVIGSDSIGISEDKPSLVEVSICLNRIVKARDGKRQDDLEEENQVEPNNYDNLDDDSKHFELV